MCELAKEQLGWVHLSTGDLLRSELDASGEKAETIRKYITAGELVPNEIVVTLVRDAMEKSTRTTGKRNFLIDGFPRSLSNMEAWHEVFGKQSELPAMLYFECPFEELEKRIMGRAKYSGRSDDNLESMKLRFDTFKAETLPTVEMFRKNNKCVEIDTSQNRETVYARVVENLAVHTEQSMAEQPLSERSEILLGLRPYPKKK